MGTLELHASESVAMAMCEGNGRDSQISLQDDATSIVDDTPAGSGKISACLLNVSLTL